MNFIESLTLPRRLTLDPAHVRLAFDLLRQSFPEVAAAVLRPDPDTGSHTLLLHTDAGRVIPGTGLSVNLPIGQIEPRLADDGYALLHAPFPRDMDLASIFPGAASVFLRRAFTGADEHVLLVFAVAGIDAEFASRHGASLLAERLLHRIDDHILHTQIQAVTRRLQRQLDEVKAVKEKLLPTPGLRVPGMRFAVHYVPCAGGGGDYFEVADLRPARQRRGDPETAACWGAMIVDVSGHGPGAAVEVAMLDSILRTYEAGPNPHPGEVLTYCNEHMFTRQLRGGFITAFLANYDANRGRLTYASAGHPAAIVKFADAARECALLECGRDIPLGVEPGHAWQSERMDFGPADMLVMYTDGAAEARSPSGQQFGIEGVREAVQESPAGDPDGVLADLVGALRRHTNGAPPGDDCTILVVQPDL